LNRGYYTVKGGAAGMMAGRGGDQGGAVTTPRGLHEKPGRRLRPEA